MKHLAAIAVSAALLAGCGSDGPTPAPPPLLPPPPPPIAIYPPPMSVPPPPPQAPPDTCGARELAYLVGRPRTEIPVPVQPSRRRVVCESCPRTMDFNPERQTIEYDAATGLVTSVVCG